VIRSHAGTTVLTLALALGAAGALLPRIALATPSLDACTGILHRDAGTTRELTVSAPGIWCLDQDMVEGMDDTDGIFIMISVDADDATIDCRGHRLVFAGSADESRGIATFGMHAQVTIRNCQFSGFSSAISVWGDDFLIEDNVVRNPVPSVLGNEKAIVGYGNGTIRRNRLHDSITLAILAKGSSQVVDNLIDGVAETPGSSSQAQGIQITQPMAAIVRGNTIRGLSSSAPNQLIGVVVAANINDARTVVADNVLVHDGSMGPVGILCDAGARVFDNVITGFFAPTVGGCVDTGDNDISP
jgi:hypothetical protein